MRPSTNSSQSENWVHSFTALKRLYKLLITYFEDALHLSTLSLAAPNLLLIAKSTKSSLDPAAEIEMIRLVGIVLAALCQSERRAEYVGMIQLMDASVQGELMGCIETVMNKVNVKRSDNSILQDLTANE